MHSRYLFPLLFAAALLALTDFPVTGQTAKGSSETPYTARPIVGTVPPMPFPPGSEAPGPVSPIQFRSPGQMTEADREVEADGESSIRERVGFAGLEFNQGVWSYQQIVCPVFPNHVLLKFTRNNGKGDESVFTASIPRMGQGRVRIIPILRRGYSLFSPAPVNGLTISAFNHIRAEEDSQTPPDWLLTGMCYAALAGAHPRVDPRPADPDASSFPSGVPAALEIQPDGGAIIRFLDDAAKPTPMQWTMIFNGKGRLLKATRAPAPPLRPTAIAPTLVETRGTPMPPTVTEVNSQP